MGARPTRRPLPAGSNRSSYGGDEIAEAFGMRVTKYGDSASVRAATQVNAEQALYGVFFVKGAPAQRIFFSFIGFLFDLTAGSSSRRALCSRRRAQGPSRLAVAPIFPMLRPGQSIP